MRNDASYTDMQGAHVTIPADALPLYALTKAGQADVLNRLLSDLANGFQLEIGENDRATLAGLASEIANASHAIVAAITQDVRSEKGGA